MKFKEKTTGQTPQLEALTKEVQRLKSELAEALDLKVTYVHNAQELVAITLTNSEHQVKKVLLTFENGLPIMPT